jgi:predicted Zn-dependent protease
MPATARLVVAVPVLVALAWFAFWAFRLGASESAVYRVGSEMITWRIQPRRETLDWVKADLNEAVSRDPNNPSLQEMLGRVSLAGSRGEAAADEAMRRFINALEQRPTSPFTWVSLVEALYHKGDTGERFQLALRRAAEIGPWEPEVEQTVANYGLAVWDDVSPSSRSAIERLVANGMVRNAAEILQISARRGRLGVACAHLDRSMRTDPKWAQLCQSTGST